MSISPRSSRCHAGTSSASPSASSESGSAATSSVMPGSDFVGDRPAVDADVVRLAEEQLQQRALAVALGRLELADAAEQRARDHAAVVEDHRSDHGRHDTGAPSLHASSGGSSASINAPRAVASAMRLASVTVTSTTTPTRPPVSAEPPSRDDEGARRRRRAPEPRGPPRRSVRAFRRPRDCRASR